MTMKNSLKMFGKDLGSLKGKTAKTEAMPEVAAERGVAVGQPEEPGKHAEDAELHAVHPGGKQADRQDAEDNLNEARART